MRALHLANMYITVVVHAQWFQVCNLTFLDFASGKKTPFSGWSATVLCVFLHMMFLLLAVNTALVSASEFAHPNRWTTCLRWQKLQKDRSSNCQPAHSFD